MLFALVNGAFKEKDQLLACAEEEGVFESIPDTISNPLNQQDQTELQVVLYEVSRSRSQPRGG